MDDTMSKEREFKYLNITRNIIILRYAVVLVLAAVAAVIGYYSETKLSIIEHQTFKDFFVSEALSVHISVRNSFASKNAATLLVSNIFATAIEGGYAGTLPNITLPGFEAIMGNIGTMADLTSMTFAPLVTDMTRHQWEAYANSHVSALKGPSYLNTSAPGRWIVSNGIGNQTAFPHTSNSGFASGSPQPTWLFPYWQETDYGAGNFMLDPRSGPTTVKSTVNQVILTKQPAITTLMTNYGSLESGVPRPSSILFSPITTYLAGNPIVGLFSGEFLWEDVLQTTVAKRIDCVVSTPTATFTVTLDADGINLTSWSDTHDTYFNQYRSSFTVESLLPGSGVTISLYPTRSFYDKYVTRTPINACALAVCLVILPSVLLVLYMYFSKVYENKLIEERNLSSTQAVSRGAVLKAKKVYVRYISHEMRTPLNAAHLGLKILEKDMEGDDNYLTSDRLQIVREVGMACDMAVTILNDLLNYDKLEDQTMIIELKKIAAISYLLESFPIFSPQAKEKGVNIIFDINHTPPKMIDNNDPNCFINLANVGGQVTEDGTGFSTYLTSNDYINVDEHKMHQVVRNMVSNAIKFTPAGKSVTIKARKVLKIKKLIMPAEEERKPKRSSFTFFTNVSMKSKASANRLLEGRMLEGRIAVDRRRSMDISRNSSNYGDIESNVMMSFEREAREQRETREPYIVSSNVSNNVSNNVSTHDIPVTPPEEEEEEDYGMLVVDVIDLGVGMKAEDTSRLFKEIIQFNPGELQAGGGSGLGMMISKGIMDLHHGDISVVSGGVGLGCTFTLTIPLSKPPVNIPDKIPLPETQPPSSPPSSPTSSSVTGSHSLSLILPTDATDDINAALTMAVRGSLSRITPPRSVSFDASPESKHPHTGFLSVPRQLNVLVVDDSHLNRKMLVRLLKAENILCDEAVDGVTAVEKARERCCRTKVRARSVGSTPFQDEGDMYDAILMDFMMPNMDGPTATKAIRELGYKGVIIGVTGNALPSDIEHFIAHGADTVLTKPVNINSLKDALRDIEVVLAPEDYNNTLEY